jgi:hypothetical protein
MADLRVFNANRPGPPREALLEATEEEGLKRCGQFIKAGKMKAGTCGTLNKTLQVAERKKERVMFQGFNVTKQKDGKYAKDGTLSTVTATMPLLINDDITAPMKPLVGGIFFSSLPDGATMTSVTLVYADYTPYGLTLLSEK